MRHPSICNAIIFATQLRNKNQAKGLQHLHPNATKWDSAPQSGVRCKASKAVSKFKKVGGHLAANFSIHNSLVLLMLSHNFKVGGQLMKTLESSNAFSKLSKNPKSCNTLQVPQLTQTGRQECLFLCAGQANFLVAYQ